MAKTTKFYVSLVDGENHPFIVGESTIYGVSQFNTKAECVEDRKNEWDNGYSDEYVYEITIKPVAKISTIKPIRVTSCKVTPIK